MMHITVRFLASVRHMVSVDEYTLDVPEGANLQQAVERLIARYPELEEHRAAWYFAVNQTQADEDTILRPGDVLSIFPYIAGG